MIYFITGSEDKFNEAKAIIPELERLDIDLVEIQDTNARNILEAKLREAATHRQGRFIVEDTSLYFDCLNGLPGPLIKWFMKTVGDKGLYEIVEKVDSGNAAQAKTIIGYYDNGTTSYFEGTVNGEIVSPRGNNGFGWDAIFLPEGSDKTFAEMTADEKNSLSMRKIAFNKLKNKLLNRR